MHGVFHLVCALAGSAAALAALPLFAELLVLSPAALLPTRPKACAAAPAFPLAVVVPAHNEELLIATCVRSILAAGEPNVSVYVVAHNCTDATAQRAAEAGAQVLVLHDEVGGKGTALDHGFNTALARGAQGVLVIDADSVVSSKLTSVISSRLAAGAAALQCRYQVANAESSARTRLSSLALLGMNVVRPRGRNRLGLSCGIFGNGFALAASTLRAVPYTANSLVEDLEYHLNLIDAGLQVGFVDDATVYGEMPDSSAAAETQRARWEGGRMLMRRRWLLPLARKVIAGRLRLAEPLLDLLALPLATEGGLLCLVILCGWLGELRPLLAYGVAGLLTLAGYVCAAALLAPSPARSLAALASAPGYVLWKILLIPRTRLAARSGAAWVRTKRNTEDREQR